MPTLNWIGKEKVINHHQEVPFKTLKNEYTYNADESENMIIHGDNLVALKSLLPKYEGKIDCVYIDIKAPRLIQFNYSSADFAA